MGWRLNPALTAFRAAVDVRFPDRDTKSDGTIGDSDHQTRKSDHNRDPDGSVDAWDMDVELNGRGKPYAADVEHLKRIFQKHEASRYWIHNDQIAHKRSDWVRRPYLPGDPDRNKHIKHVHWNTTQAFERSTRPWRIGEEDDLTQAQARLLRDAHFVLARAVPSPSGQGRVPLHAWAGWMTGAVKALTIATAGSDEATKAQLRRELDTLHTQVQQAVDGAIDEVTDNAVDAIRAIRAAIDDTDAELLAQLLANRLREVLGDQAPAVGAFLKG